MSVSFILDSLILECEGILCTNSYKVCKILEMVVSFSVQHVNM